MAEQPKSTTILHTSNRNTGLEHVLPKTQTVFPCQTETSKHDKT